MAWLPWRRKTPESEVLAPKKRAAGMFAAAKANKLFADWAITPVTSIQSSQMSLPAMRRRSRQLVNDNDYAKRLMQMVEQNVAGANGLKLQVRGRNRGPSGQPGDLDRRGNELIEMHWKRWGQPSTCTMGGRLSWADFCRKAVRHVARDGEVFIRLVRTKDNPYRTALAFVDAERIDHDYTEQRTETGNRVFMGIEVDAWFRPTAYYIRTYDSQMPDGNRRVRVPASEMIHAFLVDYEDQIRGTPWMHSAMQRLHMIGGYEQAELVAARLGAAKMGFFFTPDGATMPADGTTDEGELVSDVEPGTFQTLPQGYDFKPFDPTHPTTAFGDFMKSMLRGVASGVGITYNGLANDLEGVNYSSIRHGAIEERDSWRVIQNWMMGAICQPIYEFWLMNSLLSGALGMPEERFDKFALTVWQARGWQWVDPQKEVSAHIDAINAGLKSRTEVLAESGRDFEEVILELADEQRIAAENGVPLREMDGGSGDGEAEPEDDQDDGASS